MCVASTKMTSIQLSTLVTPACYTFTRFLNNGSLPYALEDLVEGFSPIKA